MSNQPRYQWEPVVKGVFALAVWDDSWSSYNDCYVVVEQHGLTLVDTGKSDHAGLLAGALTELGYHPRAVRTVLATHGHRDHIGGSLLFSEATKQIHAADFDLLPQDLRSEFLADLTAHGPVENFDCVLLRQHTAGSVALFHRPTKVLFCGDHICFFGRPLPAGRLVGPAQEARDGFKQFVAGWRSSWPPGEEARREMDADLAQRPAQDQQRYDFDLFRKGLLVLTEFDAVALCTGHGPVLMGNVREFLEDLSRIANPSQDQNSR